MLFAHVNADNFEQINGQRRLFFKVALKRWKFNSINFGGTLSDGVKYLNGIFFVKWKFANNAPLCCQSQRKNATAFSELGDKNLTVTNEEKIFGVVALVKKIFADIECQYFAWDFVKLPDHRFHDFTFLEAIEKVNHEKSDKISLQKILKGDSHSKQIISRSNGRRMENSRKNITGGKTTKIQVLVDEKFPSVKFFCR